jgi:hypothetical protein
MLELDLLIKRWKCDIFLYDQRFHWDNKGWVYKVLLKLVLHFNLMLMCRINALQFLVFRLFFKSVTLFLRSFSESFWPCPCFELSHLFFLYFLSVFLSFFIFHSVIHLFIHVCIHLFICLFFLNCICLQCTAWSLIFIMHPASTHRSVFSFYFEMCYIAPLNVRRNGKQSVVEEKRTSVNTRLQRTWMYCVKYVAHNFFLFALCL